MVKYEQVLVTPVPTIELTVHTGPGLVYRREVQLTVDLVTRPVHENHFDRVLEVLI